LLQNHFGLLQILYFKILNRGQVEIQSTVSKKKSSQLNNEAKNVKKLFTDWPGNIIRTNQNHPFETFVIQFTSKFSTI